MVRQNKEASESEKKSAEDTRRVTSQLESTVVSRDSVFDSSSWNHRNEQHDYFRRVASIGHQVADALSQAHTSNLLHRDIKPSNLILDTDGVVWVTDFGLAKGPDDDLTKTGDIVGTLRYMAPERFKGTTDHRSDIYSLGLTLYELCTLENAFQPSDRAQLVQQVTEQSPVAPRKIDSRIPRDLETIILKSTDRNPDRRYATAEQLADDLNSFIHDRPIRARRISSTERLWRLCRRNPVTSMLSIASLLLLVTIAVGATWFAYQSNRHAAELEAENRRASDHLRMTELTIDRMLNRVSDELRDVPKLSKVREELLSEALGLQQRMMAVESDDKGVADRTAASYLRLAKIQKLMGNRDEAIAAAKSAVSLSEDVETVHDQIELATAYSRLAGLYHSEKRMQLAADASDSALEVFEQIRPSDLKVEQQITFAESLRQRGAICEIMGELGRAEEFLLRGLEILDATILEESTIAACRQPLADTLNSLAIVYRATGRKLEAERSYRRGIEMCNALLVDEPTNVDARLMLAVSHQNLA
ncbi:MAG: protein kinase, partial [Planctomycetota bacterium]